MARTQGKNNKKHAVARAYAIAAHLQEDRKRAQQNSQKLTGVARTAEKMTETSSSPTRGKVKTS